MPDTLIELTCLAEWVSHVAATRQEAEAYALEANLWWARFQQTPCPFDEYVPAAAFAVEFGASRTRHGRWAVYVDCAWTLSRHDSIQEAVDAADRFHDPEGLSRPEIETVVFGGVYKQVEDENARPLTLIEMELVVYEETAHGVTSHAISGVQGALTTKADFLPASELLDQLTLC